MYLFFDTETTGLPRNWNAPITDLANWPRLVQLAWILFDNAGAELERNNHIIRPQGFTIPLQASNIHGITNERATTEGMELVVVLDEFNRQTQRANYLVAHNMSFDEKIIGAEFLRNGLHNPIMQINKICTMRETTNYVAIVGPFGYKYPKLSELHYKLFGYYFEEAHNAAVDINATARCFWEARKLGIL